MEQNIENINRQFQEKATAKRAQELGIQYVDIAKTPLNPDVFKVLTAEQIQSAKVVPFFKAGAKLKVAVADPGSDALKETLNALEQQGLEVELHLASVDGIEEALQTFEGTQKYKKLEMVEELEKEKLASYEKEIKGLEQVVERIDDATAPEALNMMNIGAMKTGASDIHYEPEEKTVTVRFRVDGVLHKVFELKPKTYEKIANQIKYEAKMRLNLVTAPQDGRYVFELNGKKIAVRVSSLPTPFGESFVCRFLPGGEKPLTLEELGFEKVALAKLQNACSITNGIVLVTGPTGSGKSTSMYSILSIMNGPENKIITLEDPVEYHMAGVTQSQIDEKHGYSFAGGLKTILRQDPDIIMVGEIRDFDTAETATQAALTGHVVLSTLHTNSAVETIPRLINMGLQPFMVAPALHTIVAQRLVRKVCSGCAKMEAISESEKGEFAQVFESLKKVIPDAEVSVPSQVPKVGGCESCSNTGYSGRLVIAEVLEVNDGIKKLILENASSAEILAAARKEGMLTMAEDGHIKVAQGLTTLEEVHRVTSL